MNAVNAADPGALLGSAPDLMSRAQPNASAASRKRMRERLLLECEAMMQHLLGSGTETPTELFTRYDAYLQLGEADGHLLSLGGCQRDSFGWRLLLLFVVRAEAAT